MRNGSRLLAQFENFAIEKDYREVRLYTNNLNTTHMKFIRQRGYEIVYWVSRTLMRGSLIQWKKILKPTMTSIQPIGLNITSQDSSGAETPLVSTNESSSIAESRRRSNTIVVMD